MSTISVDWETCSEDGCVGVRSDRNGRCLAHLSPGELSTALEGIASDGNVDARGVEISSELLGRIVDALPRTPEGEPRFGKADFRAATFTGEATFQSTRFDSDASFEGSTFNEDATFDGVTFKGLALFAEATFEGNAHFKGVIFKGASFPRAVFHQSAVFESSTVEAFAGFMEATFKGSAWFFKAAFHGDVDFVKATFEGEQSGFPAASFKGAARFMNAVFKGDALFGKAAFEGGAGFGGVRFGDRAQFDEATFARDAWFDGVIFGENGMFRRATFRKDARFGRVIFTGDAEFVQTNFEGVADFVDATFTGVAAFPRLTYKENALFGRATFAGDAEFGRSKFEGDARFAKATFKGRARLSETTFEREADFSRATFETDAAFSGATFERARTFGPALVRATLNLTEASFSQSVDLGVSGKRLALAKARFPQGGQVRVRWAEITLDDVDFGAPSILSGSPQFEGLDEVELEENLTESASGNRSTAPCILSVRRANVGNLLFSHVDLSRCRFAQARNLDGLRLEGAEFARAPMGMWARRKVLAEEHQWRANHGWSRRRKGWYDENVESPQWFRQADPDVENELEPHFIAAIYRDLRKGREDKRDEPGAADFYYGEMEMRRFDKTKPRAERLILWLYWLVSGYGLRASRALLSLLVTIFVFGALLYAWGFPTQRSFLDALTFSAESTTSLFRAPERSLTLAGEWLQIGLRLLGPLFFGLALLSLRGRVKR